ncbi:MAG TPA: DUF4062 domain-containing protein [Bacillota bacterium]|nr:DUF4062 domain-containing protein [Bacillota bacterium]
MSDRNDTPPYRWKPVWVFISSTFYDFHAERDYLIKYVFPDLRQWCEQWKLHLVDIDLRWGVTAVEAESGKIIDICLKYIDSSPFFLGLLGNRYGQPQKQDKIPPETLEKYPRLNDLNQQDLSVTHLEIHHALFSPLNATNDNHVAPHSFFYFRNPNSLPEPQSISSFTPVAREYYAGKFFESEPQLRMKLEQLKADIRAYYQKAGAAKGNPGEEHAHIFTYTPEFDPVLTNLEDDQLQGRFTKASLKTLGERIKADLQQALRDIYAKRIKALSEKRAEDKLESERDFHEAFVENRTRSFIGRTELLQKFSDYVRSDSRQTLAVYGETGSGKSALLAQFYKILTQPETVNLKPEALNLEPETYFIIPHFIGASPESVSLINLLRRMCEEFKQQFDIRDEIPYETNKLHETFWAFMTKATKKTIILIDGLNQLDEMEDAHSLYWLPRELPDKVKIIASSLEGDTKKVLQKKTDQSLIVTPLTIAEREEIIRLMPSVFCKNLDEKEIEMLLGKEETKNPLYLKVAVDELRVFGSYDKKLKDMIEALPANVIALYIHMLDRLVRENSAGIVERLFCLLECSRYGLTLGELEDLMEKEYEDKDKAYLGILRQIRDYIHNRGELIDFFHPSLSKAVRKKYFEEK